MCILSDKQQYTYSGNYDGNINKQHNSINKQGSVIKKDKKQHKAYLSESEEITPWSNAFNFKKFWVTSVDPRTGILSAHIKTGS
ncbi:MAG: hypothetical protein OXC48_08245, partial [Endozoicomonadaceae bacterium]|nr:hypothetical protein [Endozoicomonadaceae bacterium]